MHCLLIQIPKMVHRCLSINSNLLLIQAENSANNRVAVQLLLKVMKMVAGGGGGGGWGTRPGWKPSLRAPGKRNHPGFTSSLENYNIDLLLHPQGKAEV